jgi:glutamate racemase
MVEAGELTGPEVESAVREALAPLLGERDATGDFVFPLPASARIDTLLLGCTHYPLLRSAIAAVAGEQIAIVDSAAATASALAELLSINGLESPAMAGPAPAVANAGATHIQLTTGDVDRFRSVASRMFGDAFPDVAAVEVGPRAGRTRTATPAEVAS